MIRVTKLEANTNNGENAGGFYWNLNNSTSNRNQNITTHVLLKRMCEFIKSLPLGKIQSKVSQVLVGFNLGFEDSETQQDTRRCFYEKVW